MKQLKTESSNLYAYVKKNVVFDVKAYKTDDACCSAITSANCDTIQISAVTKNDETKELVYWLDTFIKDGDLFENGKFKPNDDHYKDIISGEPFSSYTDIYREEVATEVANDLINGCTWEYATAQMPLFYKYGSGETISDSANYKKISGSTTKPITSGDVSTYIVDYAKQKGMETVNDIIKCIDKKIEKNDITIK